MHFKELLPRSVRLDSAALHLYTAVRLGFGSRPLSLVAPAWPTTRRKHLEEGNHGNSENARWSMVTVR